MSEWRIRHFRPLACVCSETPCFALQLCLGCAVGSYVWRETEGNQRYFLATVRLYCEARNLGTGISSPSALHTALYLGSSDRTTF